MLLEHWRFKIGPDPISITSFEAEYTITLILLSFILLAVIEWLSALDVNVCPVSKSKASPS